MVCVSPTDLTETRALVLSDASCATRSLAANEVLFKAGDRKTNVYRVESGVIFHYYPRWNDDQAVVDFAFPGDLVGLGFLESHTLSARAMVETCVTCLPASEVNELVRGDPRAEAKLAEAVEREFESRRDRLHDAGQTKPVDRVAALLVNLSCSNAYEGRDPHLITDSWECGTIAEMLDLSVDDLTEILVELERRDLIEPSHPAGLRLKDIDALEALADGPAKAPDEIFNCARRSHPHKLPVHCSEAALR